jgi:3,4-dihydroxy-2-butanone 4-phosphate synthase
LPDVAVVRVELAVLCELMNEDGTMMRGGAIERFARAASRSSTAPS